MFGFMQKIDSSKMSVGSFALGVVAAMQQTSGMRELKVLATMMPFITGAELRVLEMSFGNIGATVLESVHGCLRVGWRE